ncbi:hypothetical protein D932_01141 [Enterococcus casseliflavus 14-MB-W-14]|nr:hypothetical protein D932_01141 [Enterococcus casseliflavus 14-MB-W-14]
MGILPPPKRVLYCIDWKTRKEPAKRKECHHTTAPSNEAV